MSESYNSEKTHSLSLPFGHFRYRLNGERWKCLDNGLWNASCIKMVILRKYSPRMEKGSGVLCFLPKATSMLMVACVNDQRKGEFSSAASAFQFSCPALKCSSSSSQKSGWWRMLCTRQSSSLFDFAELPVFCQSITSLTELFLYGEETSVSCCSGIMVVFVKAIRRYKSVGVLWRAIAIVFPKSKCIRGYLELVPYNKPHHASVDSCLCGRGHWRRRIQTYSRSYGMWRFRIDVLKPCWQMTVVQQTTWLW